MTDRESLTPQSEPCLVTCELDAGFAAWMSQLGGSLAVTTYQANRLALVGWNGAQVSLLMREFDKPMGLAAQENRLAIATRHEVLLLANAPLLAPDLVEEEPGRYDALYLPRASFITGDANVHDVAFGADSLWLVNTRFSCLCQPGADYSFLPRWRPPFISELAPEDRCHLNGLAIEAGVPRFVTALGESDAVGGWRDNKARGGVVVDVANNQVVLRGLSMPHSPRIYDGALWLLNSGKGEFICANLVRGDHTVVCALPGYLRGLCFVGPYAVVGLSQIRERHIFGGLPVHERFSSLQCGLAVVDLRTGQSIGMLRFTAGCQELFDICYLPGFRRPTVLNRESEQAREAFTAPEFSYWLRPSSEVRE